jgi:hypothetical protein
MTAKRRIMIRQVKEWGEILVGFETRNRYEILDEKGAQIGYAAEEGGGFGRAMGRQFFGACRKATIHIYDPGGAEVGRGEKPFRWFFHRCVAIDGEGQRLGAVQRKWSWLHRRFVIENSKGEEVLEIFSPMFRIWTFKVLFGGHEVGRISKKWGGIFREMMSDADIFGIEYEAIDDLEALRPVLIVATFLIDFTCFENNQGSNGLLSWIPTGE